MASHALSEVGDVHADQSAVGCMAPAKDLIDQLLLRDDPARISQQERKQVGFRAAKVDEQISHVKRRGGDGVSVEARGCRARPVTTSSQDGSTPCQQLRRADALPDDVIGAAIQEGDDAAWSRLVRYREDGKMARGALYEGAVDGERIGGRQVGDHEVDVASAQHGPELVPTRNDRRCTERNPTICAGPLAGSYKDARADRLSQAPPNAAMITIQFSRRRIVANSSDLTKEGAVSYPGSMNLKGRCSSRSWVRGNS
jgi:hypothetical protein